MFQIHFLSFFVIGLFSSILLAPTALGQEAGTDVDTGTGESAIVADVRITDVTFTEVNGVFFGKFLLSNYLGNQEQITYGVIAQNPVSKVVESLVLATDISLRKGESRWVDFTYPVPSYLGGEIRFSLVANTKNGLPLSVQPLLTKTFPPRDTVLSCTTTEKRDALSCVSTQDATLEVVYSLGSEFSEPVQTDTVTIVKDQVLVLTLPSRPALYFVTVRDTATQESVRMTVRVPGEYGLIQSVVLDEGATVLDGIVTALASPVAGSRLVVTLTDDAGVVCGETTLPIDAAALKFSVIPTCGSGQITLALLGGTGATLATQVMPFALVPTVSSIPGDQPETTFPLIGLAVLVSVLVLVGLFLWSKRRTSGLPPVTPLLFVAVVSIGLYAPGASAVTLSKSAIGASGEEGYRVVTTVTPDKDVYSPGGTIRINASTTVTTDAGADGLISLTDANTAYNKNASGVLWDNAVYTSASPILTNPASPNPLVLGAYSSAGPFTGYADEVLPNTMSTGSHYVRVRMNFDTSITSATQEYGNMTFTVATINVIF